MPFRSVRREALAGIRFGADDGALPEAEGYFGQDLAEREDPVERLYEAMRSGRILQVQAIGLEPWGRDGAEVADALAGVAGAQEAGLAPGKARGARRRGVEAEGSEAVTDSAGGGEGLGSSPAEGSAGSAGASDGPGGGSGTPGGADRAEALLVSVDGVPGWRGVIPPEEVGEWIGRTLGSFLGQYVAVQVLRIDRGARTVHFSRRRAKEAMAARTLRGLAVGQRHKAVVQRVGLNGAALDVGGVSAFLPAGEVSWSFVGRLEDVLRPGQAFDVEVLEVRTDEEVSAHPGRARLVVSRRRCAEDPWADVERRLRPGQYRVGRIDGVRVTPSGSRQAFVEVEPGLVILALIRFEGEVKVGDEAFVRILRVDGESRRAAGVLTRVQAPVAR